MVLVLALFTPAVEAARIATAMPAMIGQLGGLALYSWVSSAYMVQGVLS
jgi:hypothetical protein